MLGKIASSVSQTVYKLGIWYSGYRLIISISLLLIYLLTAEQLASDYDYPFLYFYTLICFIAFSIFQLFLLKILPVQVTKQLILIFLIDVICLALITFSAGGAKLTIKFAVRNRNLFFCNSTKLSALADRDTFCCHYGGLSTFYWRFF